MRGRSDLMLVSRRQGPTLQGCAGWSKWHHPVFFLCLPPGATCGEVRITENSIDTSGDGISRPEPPLPSFSEATKATREGFRYIQRPFIVSPAWPRTRCCNIPSTDEVISHPRPHAVDSDSDPCVGGVCTANVALAGAEHRCRGRRLGFPGKTVEDEADDDHTTEQLVVGRVGTSVYLGEAHRRRAKSHA
ncbi:hypothetical protein B0T11DRAFT_118871 [Plectosphaerella cucumerina]|uniref:Uncharacterized protein n=1 Tax=Plectosphaerella cucumerina TaxID=40658 RepID=A0A8K0TDP8_9PEZI|nr:hypothetical protein B0T11DRAFT_118871 [Plectosphaerella cucumerina]